MALAVACPSPPRTRCGSHAAAALHFGFRSDFPASLSLAVRPQTRRRCRVRRNICCEELQALPRAALALAELRVTAHPCLSH